MSFTTDVYHIDGSDGTEFTNYKLRDVLGLCRILVSLNLAS